MQFGIREICDVVFKAKTAGKLGSMDVRPGQPVLYIDTAKTSTMEGAATTVYAQGGKGNARLIAWEGERTLTFTVEDALLSEMGFAILSGAGLITATKEEPVYVHQTSVAYVDSNGVIDLTNTDEPFEIDTGSPIFAMVMEHGTIIPNGFIGGLEPAGAMKLSGAQAYANKTVFVDFYIKKTSKATEMTIDVENFAGYYYVEASTLFRRQSDGKDFPAELIFPNVKIQSNFTFSMAATGDPSTFTFTMDAMPGYTRFNRTKKVLCAMQVIEEGVTDDIASLDSVDLPAEEEKEYPLTSTDIVYATFYSNDGTVKINTIAAEKNGKITLPTAGNTETKTFSGWALEVNAIEPGEELSAGKDYVLVDNIPFYGVWVDN